MKLPRYFAPRNCAAPERLGPEARVARPIDLFMLRGKTGETEWVVGFDDAGKFVAQPCGPSSELPARAKSEVSFHERSSAGRRVLRLETLFLFELSLLDETPDSPGIDDPVHAYGTLVGPVSANPAVDGSPGRIEGQLTSSRGDVLAGLVAGARWPFHRVDPATGRVARTFNLLVGGDREEAVSNGHGAVAIYPVLGAERSVDALYAGNEEMVRQILYDLLTGWWRDVAKEDRVPFRRARQIPTPDRPHGVGAYLELAAEALSMSPAWPSRSVIALNRRVGLPAGSRRAGMSSVDAPSGWVHAFTATHMNDEGWSLPPDRGLDAPAGRAAAESTAPAMASATAVLQMLERKFDLGEDDD